jgi:ankyrin repeat protein
MPLPSSPEAVPEKEEQRLLAIAMALVTACQQDDLAQIQALVARCPSAIRYRISVPAATATTDASSTTSASPTAFTGSRITTPWQQAVASGASLEAIQALVAADPSLLWGSNDGDNMDQEDSGTALHLAASCPATRGALVDWLLRQPLPPQAPLHAQQEPQQIAQIADARGRTALHAVCGGSRRDGAPRTHADLGIVQKIYHAWPAAIGQTDDHNLLPFHMAFLSGAPGSYLKYLASLYPSAVSTPLPNGRLVVHCLVDKDDGAGNRTDNNKYCCYSDDVLASLLQADPATLYLPDPATGQTLHQRAHTLSWPLQELIRAYAQDKHSGNFSTGGTPTTPTNTTTTTTIGFTKKEETSPTMCKAASTATATNDPAKTLKGSRSGTDCKLLASRPMLYSDEQVADRIVRACAAAGPTEPSSTATGLEEITLLVQTYPNAVRVRDAEGFLPLHWACYHGAVASVLQVLVAAWPESVRETISYGRLPLHLACRQNATLDRVQVLVPKYPAALEQASTQGMLPLHYACRDGAPLEVIRFLVDQAPMTLSEANANGSLPIHFACKDGKKCNPDIIQFLVERWPACLREPGKRGLLPIHLLCRGSSTASSWNALDWMVDQDSHVLTVADAEGNLALHHLCQNSKATIAAVSAVLKGHPEATTHTNANNLTPMDLAADKNPAVSIFLSETAKKRRKTGGSHPLHQACSDPHVTVQTIQGILAESPDEVCVPDGERCLPIHIACRSGASVDVIRCLAQDWPESLCWTNKGGSLPLHTACSNKASVTVVQYLVSMLPNATGIANHYGWLPLHCACTYGASSDVIQLLIQSNDKSSRMATYGQGDYPLHLACAASSPLEVVGWLSESGPESVKLTNLAGELPLHKACSSHAPLEVIQFLVEQCPESVFATNDYGATPQQIAERSKQYEVAEWLKSRAV